MTMSPEEIKKVHSDILRIWSGWKIYRIYVFILSNRVFFLSLGGALLLIGFGFFLGLFGDERTANIGGAVALLVGFVIISMFFAPIYGANFMYPKIKEEFFEHLKAYSRIRNMKYKVVGEEFTKDFLASKLYPYQLTKVKGSDYFSGFSGIFPFLIWNVWAWFQEKSFQSPMTNAAVNTSYIGFAGDQVLFKNKASSHGHLIIFSKKADEYFVDLLQKFKTNKNLKQSEFSNPSYTKNFFAFRTGNFSGLSSRIFDYILEIHKANPDGIAIHFSPDLIYVNLLTERKWLVGSTFESPDKVLAENIIRFSNLMGVPNLLEKALQGKKYGEE